MNLTLIGILILVLNLVTLALILFFSTKRSNFIDPKTKNPIIPKEIIQQYGISQRETDIALAILEGKTNSEIAEEKLISVTTVKKHVYNLFQKTNSRNRVEFINRLRKAI